MTSLKTNEVKRSRNQELFGQFIEEYRFVLAMSPDVKKKALSLRHEVFLQELRYKMHEDQAHHLETDEYDDSSIHCLIEHKRSGLPAGCMRLVIPSSDPESPFHKLPVEIQGSGKLNHSMLKPGNMPRHQLCEVSRLAISRNFRSRQTGENHTSIIFDGQDFSSMEVRTFPLIAIGLFLCTYSLVGLTGRRHVFAMMESRLPRLLALSGFHFTKVSDEIEHHGLRNAYYIDHSKAEKEMHEDLIPLYLHIRKELSFQLKEVPVHEARVSCS
ncbi:PEP-CTERM/exosortase system-associated acyltransferase [Halomonas sp. ATCH28]|uniref:PEP-CTERM/exosortase system-associated acyltransferase n=1 Tax=Halomonas gemina TaxID=2945105 RepID=A0ABT0T4L0_9GAMM|nr:PEP-CTERM/exosortase system-associated acyltransferase [Halomonas gemina]MCL7941860.1 PEP-CTERM/exosortase system-associated acyltransferase [Halomonas gemina]